MYHERPHGKFSDFKFSKPGHVERDIVVQMNISPCYTILREAIPSMDLEKIYHVTLPQRHMDKSSEREKIGLINPV